MLKQRGTGWRRRLERFLPAAVRPGVVSRLFDTGGDPQWARETMAADTLTELMRLEPLTLNIAEISGRTWQHLGWRSYTPLDFPEFDVCEPDAASLGVYDLVLCEQVLEHVVDPIRAVQTLRKLCAPGGHVLVSTPFLVRIHDYPGDYWRFTPDGLRLLLRHGGLEPLWIRSWGNRRVIAANFDRWVARLPWQTLRNEERLPIVVWSLSRPA